MMHSNSQASSVWQYFHLSFYSISILGESEIEYSERHSNRVSIIRCNILYTWNRISESRLGEMALLAQRGKLNFEFEAKCDGNFMKVRLNVFCYKSLFVRQYHLLENSVNLKIRFLFFFVKLFCHYSHFWLFFRLTVSNERKSTVVQWNVWYTKDQQQGKLIKKAESEKDEYEPKKKKMLKIICWRNIAKAYFTYQNGFLTLTVFVFVIDVSLVCSFGMAIHFEWI